MNKLTIFISTCCLLAAAPSASCREAIQLANNPSLSPDGSMLAFDWNGDIWTVPVTGGLARPLSQHPARDREPKFSPDGKEIAFTSEREGGYQVHVVAAQGGTPKQLTFHSGGYGLDGWYPDGKGLLVTGTRDHFWRNGERFFRIERDRRGPDQLLFDDYGRDASLSPDGKRLLFTREGPAWWRKGYRGAHASQVWLHDLDGKGFTRVLDDERGCSWPLWKPDGKGFYYVGARSGSCNLWEHDLASGKGRQLTRFTDDSVVFPCISRDGSTIVFRHLFDFYAYRPGSEDSPRKLDIWHEGDRVTERRDRRVLQQASEVAFSQDGLEIAFIAGGDLWVMDTELREPRQITATPEEERYPVFAPDGESILFASDMKGQSEVWKAERADRQKYWWQNRSFKMAQLTQDGEAKARLRWSPDGSHIAYVRGRGDLWIADAGGKNPRRVLQSWNMPEYDWAPDGKWLVYAQSDSDFNRDIWLIPADISAKPFNLSRHPYNEQDPTWSPDGKLIAFSGRRASGTGAALCFVWLRTEDEEINARDRSLEKALDKINKARKPAPKKAEPPMSPDSDEEEVSKPPVVKKPGGRDVAIDFDRLPERVHRVPIEGTILDIFWSPDSTKLAFTGMVEGKLGTYTIDIPSNLKPRSLAGQVGSQPRWLRQGNQVVWLSGGVPGSLPAAGAAARAPTTPAPTKPSASAGPRSDDSPAGTSAGTAYRFQTLQIVDVPKKNAAAFDLCWRTMRDQWYDERLGNRDWDKVRQKYRDLAAYAPDTETLATVVHLMLGELNGSHLGFTPAERPASGSRRGPRSEETPVTDWREVTAHLGVRFDPEHKGPGLKVRDVLPGGPAETKRSHILPGDTVMSIDGAAVGRATDLTTILNGILARDFQLKLKGPDGKEREVILRPISYEAARVLLYEKWLQDNRKAVEESSKGSLGYLHISAMNMTSFQKFEEELYSVGSGKDGLVIDVRENRGGSTTDHLLTALTQPVHAITVPRGGSPGYPQDRKVYGTWNKPIVVLCNQNSFSNAEIFSHAIKTLKRGKLVGVATGGGVVSTGAMTIMDVGVLRLPTRGWFLINDGQDMEMNGAVPDFVLWPEPGHLPRGKDMQLDKAVEVLLADVKAWRDRPQPTLRKATER